VKVLALDYGRARTGVAVSDPTGTLARPLAIIERVTTEAGLQKLRSLIEEEQPERIVVGLPLTLRGERGLQALETDEFIERVREIAPVPVDAWDERFTTALAGGGKVDDARAAAHLLTSYLTWLSGARN
jgi:putative holliday junction resolvase